MVAKKPYLDAEITIHGDDMRHLLVESSESPSAVPSSEGGQVKLGEERLKTDGSELGFLHLVHPAVVAASLQLGRQNSHKVKIGRKNLHKINGRKQKVFGDNLRI